MKRSLQIMLMFFSFFAIQPAISGASYSKLDDETLKQTLSKVQYYVTQQDGTEVAYKNAYWDHKQVGIYVDVVSGEPLFSSTDKYNSKTGWPSFTKPLDAKYIILKKDYFLIYPRIEVRSKYADSHLGHVFNDGPAPTHKRYCINSAALRFVPLSELKKQGYEKYLVLFKRSSDL